MEGGRETGREKERRGKGGREKKRRSAPLQQKTDLLRLNPADQRSFRLSVFPSRVTEFLYVFCLFLFNSQRKSGIRSNTERNQWLQFMVFLFFNPHRHRTYSWLQQQSGNQESRCIFMYFSFLSPISRQKTVRSKATLTGHYSKSHSFFICFVLSLKERRK